MQEGWIEVPKSDLAEWNRRLLCTSAHLHQYPLWNEPLRRIRAAPDYLVYTRDGRSLAWIAVLIVGVGPLRFGLVRGGPVSLDGEPVAPVAMNALCQWGRKRGIAWLRLAHPDPEPVETVAACAPSRRADLFPFYPHPEPDLVVGLLEDEAAMLSGFQKVARQEIRKAAQAGYDLEWTADAEKLAPAWPMFQSLNQRKGHRVYNRPLESYQELMRLSEPCRCARLYLARLRGRLVQAALLVRDRDSAHYVAGALDVEALEGNVSPACLVHWTAMRDFSVMGARRYVLGGRGSGGLQVFKNKFHPHQWEWAPPVSLALRPALARLWSVSLPLVDRYSARLSHAASMILEAAGRLQKRRG